MSGYIFKGKDGRKPSTEARRFVYARLVELLDANRDQILAEIGNEFDRRRLGEAIRYVRKALARKSVDA